MNRDNLKNFREEWVRELNKKVQRSCDGGHNSNFSSDDGGKRECHNRVGGSVNSFDENSLNDDQNNEGNRKFSIEKIDTQKSSRLRSRDGKLKQKNKTESEISFVANKRPKKEVKENFLDILIADIDELISLPFFDLELPKEIAIKIFQYLSVKDLGRCACVNKKWKVLADDDLIWFDFCKNHGFVNGDSCPLDREGWKEIFREESQSAKCFHQNWKQRICQISELEYEKGMKK